MTAPSGDFSDFIVSLAERQAPPAPDTTGGELRSDDAPAVRDALCRYLNDMADYSDRGDLDGDFRELWGYVAPALRDLLAERDKLAAQVQAVEGLADELSGWPSSRILSPHDAADRIRRALGTPTTGGGE